MIDNVKMKRTTMVLLALVGLLILRFVYAIIRGFILYDNTMIWDALHIVNFIIGLTLPMGILIITLLILLSIRRNVTPFNLKNVKLLKAISILLVMYEPVSWIMGNLLSHFHPIIMNDGSSVVIRTSLGGIVIVTGLAVYCISLVFQYGISLQVQVDETL